ncbi:ABC-type sugar transport system ATPase subunit/ribose/xylose/arabinose/galactoside ABC-type transport system permease subunit [Streptomyces canus]
MAPEPTLLSMSGITKSFPGVRALDGVDLDVQAGEVHCLLGQNGAGKSTLIKVLAGAHQPDTGRLRWLGEEVSLRSPIAAMRLGIATIYQELDLVEHLSVAENVHLGHEPTTAGFVVRGKAARQSTAALLRRLGHPEIDPARLVGELSAAQQQIVSMARALSHDVRLIVMDEPSAALDPDEVDNLFRIVGDLTAAGVAVVYISHRLEEIRRIGDRVTVLKDGRAVAVGLPAKSTPTREIVALMTGRNVEYVFPERPPADVKDRGEPLLEVQGLSRQGEFEPLDLLIHPGEIVGLAGLVGSGRSEILETIYGARKPTAGQVAVDGKALKPGSVRAAVRAGIGLAPEERKAQALLMLESVTRNVSVSSMSRFSRVGWIDRGAERGAARAATRRTVAAARQPLRAHPHPVRRQPAEGRPGPLAAARLPCPAARRTHPGRRRRRPRRAVRGRPAPGRRRTGRAAGLQRGPRGARPRRPRPGAPRGPCRAPGARPRARRTPCTRPRHGRKSGVMTQPVSPPRGSADKVPPASEPSAWRGMFARADVRTLSLLGVLAVLVLIGGITKPDEFLDTRNLQLVLTQASVIGVVTVGMTFVITSGGIDLSVGAIVALASVWATTVATQEYGFAGILFTAVIVGVGCGLVNGLLIAYGAMVPFIATLAMLASARGLALQITDGRTQIVTVPSVLDLGERDAYVLGIPPLVMVFAVVTIIGWLVLNRTTFGRRTVAVGGNAEAARLAGIDVRRQRLYLYLLSGLCCGIAAFLLIILSGSGQNTNGNLYELDAIAAAIIGGTLLSGGRGTITGSVLGVLIFTTITNIFALNNLQSDVQQIAKGAIIVAAVLVQRRTASTT